METNIRTASTHDYRQIIMRGDHDANPDAQYFVLVGLNRLIAGVRTAEGLPAELVPRQPRPEPKGLAPRRGDLPPDLNVLNLWLDGSHVAYQSVPSHSTAGNTLSLQHGRNSPATGKYWLGKLERIGCSSGLLR